MRRTAPALGWVWQDYGRRADHLDLKEKELRAKEAELRKLEQDLRSTGALKPEKNWPPCCAFTHHDIAGEVATLLEPPLHAEDALCGHTESVQPVMRWSSSLGVKSGWRGFVSGSVHFIMCISSHSCSL